MPLRDVSLAFALLPLVPFVAACTSSRAPSDSTASAPSASSSASVSSVVVQEKPLPPTAREGSTVTRAPQDDVLFVADEDHQSIHILPFPIFEDTAATTIALPGRPAQVLASRDRVIVSIRELPEGGGALVLFKREGKLGLKETARVALSADAWGLALAPDESFVVVTSAWSARVSVVDLATAKVRSVVNVGREPRGVTILPDGKRAYVSHIAGAAITRIGDLDGATPTVTKFDLPAAPHREGGTTNASLGYSVVQNVRGDRLFFPRHALGTAIGDWYGSAAVDGWLPINDTPLAAPLNKKPLQAVVNSSEGDSIYAGPGLRPGTDAFVQPRAAVYRASEKTILVASEGTDTLVELDALIQDPTFGVLRTYDLGRFENKFYHVATRCGAPSGIALSSNEQVAYVYCRTTDELMALRLVPVRSGQRVVPPVVVRLVEPKPTPEEESYRLGRLLYYNATDRVTSENMACAGCHPDGRDDGHVWHEARFSSSAFEENFTNFMASMDSFGAIHERATVTGAYGCGAMMPFEAVDISQDKDENITGMGHPRQTPMIAGRVSAPGPYGWHAESETLVARLEGGFGLHRWRLGEGTSDNRKARAGHLAKFIREGLVPPQALKRELSEEEKKGKTIFDSETAQCAKCHVPATGFTDRIPMPVGEPPVLPGFIQEENIAFKTPSLLFVQGTAPYFHDGRYASLQELIEKNADKMGKTAHLSAEEKKALVAYLETL